MRWAAQPFSGAAGVKGQGSKSAWRRQLPTDLPSGAWSFPLLIQLPTHVPFFLSPPCFHDQKKIFFYFFRVFFFFKVITEQVVVDANLPSVSKESVGQEKVGDNGGGRADAAPSPAHGGQGLGVDSPGAGPGCPEALTA